MEAPRLAGQRPAAVVGRAVPVGLLADFELGVGRVGLGGALGGLDPEDLEIGERGPELILREPVALLELAQDGADLEAQPALLGVGPQQQADVGGRGYFLMILGHASIRARRGST